MLHQKKKKYNIRTTYGTFEIILESDNDEKGYTVRVSKFPEIITEGRTVEDAKKMAKEAIELCVECKENEHNPNPKGKRYSSHITSSRV